MSLSASTQNASPAVRMTLLLFLAAFVVGAATFIENPSALAQSGAEGEKSADESDESTEATGTEEPAEGAATSTTADAALDAAPKEAVKPQKTDADVKSGPRDAELEEVAGPAGWPAGKPPGPGPQGWPEGKTAKDFSNPDKEATDGGPEGWNAEDGIGVACQDYIACVCVMSERTKGKPQAGYNHEGTCKVAKTYTTPDYEEVCAEELDQLKDALEDAKEDYKANGIKLPPSCQ